MHGCVLCSSISPGRPGRQIISQSLERLTKQPANLRAKQPSLLGLKRAVLQYTYTFCAVLCWGKRMGKEGRSGQVLQSGKLEATLCNTYPLATPPSPVPIATEVHIPAKSLVQDTEIMYHSQRLERPLTFPPISLVIQRHTLPLSALEPIRKDSR